MRTKYRIIKTEEELNKLIKCCKETGYACIDFETNAEPIYNKTFKPTILSVTFQPGFGCSIPLQHHEAKNKKFCGNDWNWKKMFSKFGHEVIENPDIVKCSWNGKFDFQIFELYGIYLRGTMIDGMLAKYVLNEERPNGLKDMVKRYLPEAAGYEADKGFDKLPWDKKPLDDLCKYGCQDTDYTFRLCIFFESRLIELGLYDLYRNLIMPASRVLQTCEANGLYMDRKFNKELLETYKPKIDKARETCMNLPKVKRFQKWYSQQKINKYIKSIQDELDELDPNDPKDKRKIASREQKISNIEAGIFTTKKEKELVRPVNLGSPVDLPILMFSEEGFNMPIIKYTVDKKTGKESNKPSTDEETLTELRLKFKNPKSPKAIFLDSLLELRGLEKMYKTYILGWSEKVQDDDCLHGRYLIHGCVTGDTMLVGSEKDIRIDSICPKEIGVKNIEDQNIWVLSHEGTWEQVTHTINKGNLPTYRIVTTEGKELRCTKNHKLLTPFGMKRVSYIYRHNLPIIMHDVSRLNIEHFETGKSSKEVIYKEIPNWPGYLASNEGKIYSVKVIGSRGVLDYNHPHELVPRLIKGGYHVYLRNNTKKKYAFNVSRLIWETFKGVIPKGFVIDHIDCNRTNNILENLQCISYSDNTRRAYGLTRKAYTNGGINGRTITNTQNVGSILYEYSQGYTQQQLVDKYGISQKQISRIINKKAWKYIYISHIEKLEYLGELPIYDLSVNNKHSYVTRSNFINSNTDSGRLSSQEPNMQQIPKTSVDPNIKKQLVAKPGTLYLVCDFSQAELRIMAHLSGDETYLNAFNSGQDPHLAIAAKKYGIPYEEAYKIYDDENHPDHGIWKVRRKQAKQIAFGLIYGIGAKLLAVKLSDPKSGLIVTPEEAQKEMDIFFKQHPKLKTFKAKQEKFLKKYGYLKSLFGRKRRLPQIYSDNKQEQAYAIRLALNFPCQSAASDMTLFGSVLIYYMMRQGKLPMMQEVATVHDATYNNTDPNYINIWTVHTMWKIFSNPSTKNFFGFQISDVTMDMDYTIGRTMAEELPFIPGYDYNKMLQPDFSVEEYMEEHKKYKGISIADFPKLYKKEMKAYEESWIKYKDFKHVKKCGIL